MLGPRTEPASFRDPASRVFYSGDDVLRALAPQGLEDWRRLESTEFFRRAAAAGKVVATGLAEDVAPPAGYAATLRHERIPFVSYPYEWSFSMLQDAALLELDLLLEALAEDMTLKDASPYNVQFVGSRPTLIDVGSFEELRQGEPWAGYRQFCMLFLNPLLLQALRGVPFNARLRGSVDGIPPGELRRLLSGRDLLRRGVLTHVRLHASLERRYADRSRDVRRELRAAGFNVELLRANARKLRRVVGGLEWEPDTEWTRYAAPSYDERDAALKTDFVEKAAAAVRPRLLWDLGCNDGRYTRVAASHAEYAVGVDADPGAVELLYRSLRSEGSERILPLVVDLADPSPGLGWRGLERRPLWERGTPELVLGLALVHHLAISANVPLAELLDWLRGLDSALVVEWVDPEDEMARRLLTAKREGLHDDYERSRFEALLGDRFAIERAQELADGRRVLYLAK
jgi:SAM-dependent methyltransferase